MRRVFLILLVASTALAGCGDGGSKATSTTTRRPPATKATTTTTALSSTTTPSTTTPSTTAACAPIGSTAAVRDQFPNRMSQLVGKDVRTGAHRCYDRFVIELGPAAAGYQFPGYFVRSVPKPITLSPSGLPVTIKGSAVLMVSLGVWIISPDGSGYQGPDDVFPTNVTTILEYRLTENFEGQSAFALGLDRARSFRVSTLVAPPRLVVDVSKA